MTGEQLNRKYHELRGWTRVKEAGYIFYHAAACPREINAGRMCVPHPLCSCSGALPPLHEDANLAIAEAVKVFTNGFDLWHSPNESGVGLQWGFSRIEDMHKSISGHHDGATPNEAILKALIAAKESQ